MIKHILRHSHSLARRGFISFCVVAVVMIIGTVGLHSLERIGWLEAFYFMSMIATAQGSTFTPETAAGLVFLSLMAFVSVGIVIGALGFLFGPFLGVLGHIGVKKLEEELELLKKNKKKGP